MSYVPVYQKKHRVKCERTPGTLPYLLHIAEAKHDILTHPGGPWGGFLTHDPGTVFGILRNRKTQELSVREHNRHPRSFCHKYPRLPVWPRVYGGVNGQKGRGIDHCKNILILRMEQSPEGTMEPEKRKWHKASAHICHICPHGIASKSPCPSFDQVLIKSSSSAGERKPRRQRWPKRR